MSSMGMSEYLPGFLSEWLDWLDDIDAREVDWASISVLMSTVGVSEILPGFLRGLGRGLADLDLPKPVP